MEMTRRDAADLVKFINLPGASWNTIAGNMGFFESHDLLDNRLRQEIKKRVEQLVQKDGEVISNSCPAKVIYVASICTSTKVLTQLTKQERWKRLKPTSASIINFLHTCKINNDTKLLTAFFRLPKVQQFPEWEEVLGNEQKIGNSSIQQWLLTDAACAVIESILKKSKDFRRNFGPTWEKIKSINRSSIPTSTN